MSKEQTKIFNHTARISETNVMPVDILNERMQWIGGITATGQYCKEHREFIKDCFNVANETGLTPSQLQHENKELKERNVRLNNELNDRVYTEIKLKEQRDELMKLVGRFVAGIQLDGEVNEYSPVYSDARTYKDKITSTKQD